jgi:hypothetical protein
MITWIFGAKTAETPTAPEAPYKVEVAVVPTAITDVPVVLPVEKAEAVTTTVLEVKPSFKKADLEKKTKAELLALAQERGLEVKARAVKADLIKVLLKS